MSIEIKEILLNQADYAEGNPLTITARLENQSDEAATALLEALLTSQTTAFPTIVRHAQVSLKPHGVVAVIVYDLQIDEKFQTDYYTVYVGLANQMGEGSSAQKTFNVKTKASLA